MSFTAINNLISVSLILLVCASTLSAQNDREVLYDGPLGVQAFTFRNYFPKDFITTLDTISAMGFTEIEGGGSSISDDDYRRLCEERGIRIPSVGASFDQLQKDPQAVAQKAVNLGAKYAMCAWVPHETGHFTRANADKAIEVFTAAGKILKKHGVMLTYHFHGYEFQPHGEGTLLDYIIENTDPEFVNFEMDIMWIHFGGGDPVALMKKYPTRWKLMHLKDLKKGTPKDLTGGTNQEFNVVLGQGELDMPAIMRTAQEIGIAHYFIEDESSRIYEQLPKSIAYLRGEH